MSRRTKAITYTGVNRVAVCTYELDELGPADVLVRTRYTMVSSVTELRVLGGHYGAAGNYPLIPGYASVGEVIEAGPEAAGFPVGDAVSCRNPKPVPGVHAQWGGQAGLQVHATGGEDRPILLPAGADLLDFVTVEISAISLRGVTAANPQPGETAVVLGQGLIGAFSAAWLNAAGCRVIATDLEAGRLERARAWSAATLNLSAGDAEARLRVLCNGGADIVVECSGTPQGAELAFRPVRRKPQAYGTAYKVEPIQFYPGDWARLIVQANYLDPVHINPVAEAPAAYAALRDDRNRNFSPVFDWEKA